MESEATYLLWIDCTKVLRSDRELQPFLREKAGLYLSAGEEYGGDGANFLRMNIACPRSVVEEGLARLKRGLEM